MDSQHLWSCGLISSKTIQIFLKNFLKFKFDIVEKQGIINVNSKSYASAVLSDSEVTFFPFLCCILLIV